jgi:tetratricopeptide (TPR) repeat protein
MPLPRRLHAPAVLVLLFSASAVAAQPTPLLRLALDDLPADASASIEPAYRDAATHPDDGARVGRLGMVLHAWQQLEQAAVVYARAASLAPGTFDWPYLGATLAARAARFDEAARLLEHAVKLRPDYLPARVRLGEALFESGRHAESAALFETLAREPAAAAPAEYWLGRLAASRRPEKAVEHFRRAIERFPGFGAAYYAMAMAYRDLGKPDEAKAALEHHVKFGAQWPGLDDPVQAAVTALRTDPRAQVQRGVAFATAGDVEGAIAVHEAALRADPSLVQAHANLISLYGRSGKWELAETHYRAVIKAGTHLDEAHYNYGLTLAMQQRGADARRAYEQALAANPLYAPARSALAQILEQEGNLEGALVEYRKAAADVPTLRAARFNAGRMLIALKRYDEAVKELEPLRTPEDEETPRYVFALATAHVHAGRSAEGKALATEARSLALKFGQAELAAAIDRHLESLSR